MNNVQFWYIHFQPTNQCRKIFAASDLLPEKNSGNRPPRTLAQAWVIPPSLPGIDATAPSSPTTAPKLLSKAGKTAPDVCFRSTLFALSSVFLPASCNVHPSMVSSSTSQSVLNPKKISYFPLYPLMYFSSVLHADPLSTARLLLHVRSNLSF